MTRNRATRPLARGWAGLCLGMVLLAGPTAAADSPVLSLRPQQLYQDICATCHASPGSGAPVTGDAEAWREPNAQGFDALLIHTVDGFGSMPPLGTCGSCSEAEMRVLISYMSGLPDPGR